MPVYHNCPVFAAGDAYNAAVTNAPIDPNSANYVQSMYAHGANQGFAVYNVNPPIIEGNLATNSTATYTVQVTSTHRNDFPLPVPWQSNFFYGANSDAHAVVINTSTCELYEMYNTAFNGSTLSAYSGWEWNMTRAFAGTSTSTPPAGTSNPSAMASGLSEFAGAIRATDIAARAINHALNFQPPAGSIDCSAIVWPATGTGGCGGYTPPSTYATPYGAHFRLHANFTLTCGSMCPQAQMVVQAMKTYGIYIADTGSHIAAPQMQIMPDNGATNPFNSSDLANLSQIHITDFDMLTP